ncbi:MAG: ATPase, T2SS/T4P/T4SS family [Planctomycetia bacterium]|nr:ATPase, T2SS/T4P/T4SS family [Planctomycetia bacterium]
MRQISLMRILGVILLGAALLFGVSDCAPSFLSLHSACAQGDLESEESLEASDDVAAGGENAEAGGSDEGFDGEMSDESAQNNFVAPTDNFSFSRDWGKGWYIALWKFFLVLILYLAWVFSTDWLSRDCQKYRMGIAKWVPIVYGSFLGSLLVFWLIPWFFLGFLILLAAYLTPLIWYIILRNRDLSTGEQVMTLAHLRFLFSELLALCGVNFAAVARDKHETGFPIVLHPALDDKELSETCRIQARAHSGFPDAREMLSKVMEMHPEGIMLDYTAGGVSIKYLLDGVWNNAPVFPRDKATSALQALKILCGLKPEDRKNRQEGKFRAVFEYTYDFPEDRLRIKHATEALAKVPKDDVAAKRDAEAKLRVAKEEMRQPVKRKRTVIVHMTSQGVQGGERVMMQFEEGKSSFDSLDAIGMPEEMQKTMREQMSQSRGFILFSAPPSNGLRTTMKCTFLKTDRYTREFMEIQDGIHKYDEVENIAVDTCASKELAEWRETLRSTFLKDPDVVVMRDIPFHEILDDMLDELDEADRFFVTCIRAKDSAEALLRVMATKCNAEKWAKSVNAVVCQRLVRKLCEHCKEAYTPNAAALEQLGIAPGKYTFYRPAAPKPRVAGKEAPEPCKECRGLGYSGRTGIFELVIVGDETRKALLTQPKVEIVRKALRKDGNKFMMEGGIQLVRAGVTSLQEIKRALS